ncbi:MAG: hypothetical protein F4X66_04025 [Chloroflexi bacterium]|nr:hypothetical protein [Chloroflexota bacterium]MYE41338.1 hypothetical protein [Chloroflexota bacterium]
MEDKQDNESQTEQANGPYGNGNFYWCVKTSESKKTGEIYVWADEVRVDHVGSLVFFHQKDDREHINLVISTGSWSSFYAASVWDGHAVAVQEWEGEVVR